MLFLQRFGEIQMDTLAAKMAVKFREIAHFCMNADEKHNTERKERMLFASKRFVGIFHDFRDVFQTNDSLMYFFPGLDVSKI